MNKYYAIKENGSWINFRVENRATGWKKDVKINDIRKKIASLIPGCDISTLCSDANCPVIIYTAKYDFLISDFIINS
jgi:hypothetical protein